MNASASATRSSRLLVLAGFMISFVVVGGGIETVSVFINGISTATHWSRSSLSLGVGVGAVMAALSTLPVGMLVDRYGIRVPMLAGVGLLAVGFVILTRMQQPSHFAIANLFLGPGFAACALLPITIAVTICIPERTALALGTVAAGASAGTLILAPALQALIEATDWRHAYMAMGSAVVLTPLPFLALALPRGRLRPQAEPGHPGAGGHPLRVFLQPGVAALAGVMVLPGLAAFSISVHLVPYLTGLGHSGTAAAAALGAMVGISAIGKVGGGFAGDRVGALSAVKLALATDVVALMLLQYAAAPRALIAFVVLHGLAIGTQVAVVPAIAAAVMGTQRFGTMFGVLQLATMLASAVGPVVSGLIFDRTGQYSMAVLLWLAAFLAATALAFWIPSRRPAEAPRQVAVA